MQGMVHPRPRTSLALPQPVAVACTLQEGKDGDGDGEPNLEGQGVPRLHHTAGEHVRQALKSQADLKGRMKLPAYPALGCAPSRALQCWPCDNLSIFVASTLCKFWGGDHLPRQECRPDLCLKSLTVPRPGTPAGAASTMAVQRQSAL